MHFVYEFVEFDLKHVQLHDVSEDRNTKSVVHYFMTKRVRVVKCSNGSCIHAILNVEHVHWPVIDFPFSIQFVKTYVSIRIL